MSRLWTTPNGCAVLRSTTPACGGLRPRSRSRVAGAGSKDAGAGPAGRIGRSRRGCPVLRSQADAAVDAGATAAEIVDVLVAVTPVVGLPHVVAAAPKLAMALGYDTNDALEPQSGG